MNLDDVKIKYISQDEFVSYLDWLTRFKNPVDNLLRVCKKIITKNLISPKLSVKKQEELTFYEKFKITQYIWNSSLNNLIGSRMQRNDNLKQFLIYEEFKTFNTDVILDEVKSYDEEQNFNISDYFSLRNDMFLDIDCLIEYLSDKNIEKTFFKRLLSKKQSNLSKEELFSQNNIYASIKALFLVEGITEEKIFPVFADKISMNFQSSGIKLKSAGGKTQIVKYYTKIRKLLKIPVFILLDADGKDIINELNSILEKKDKIYLISKGEIEDILPHSLIVRAINNYYNTEGSIQNGDLQKSEPMTKVLYNLYKEKGFGEFHKAKFAQIIQENITSKDDLSEEIKDILEKLKTII